jgi:hypothetical protein
MMCRQTSLEVGVISLLALSHGTGSARIKLQHTRAIPGFHLLTHPKHVLYLPWQYILQDDMTGQSRLV